VQGHAKANVINVTAGFCYESGLFADYAAWGK